MSTRKFTGLSEIGVEQPHPRFIKGTKEHRFVRVAAGAGHSLALTTSGQVWSFGQGSFGTLGTSPFCALLLLQQYDLNQSWKSFVKIAMHWLDVLTPLFMCSLNG